MKYFFPISIEIRNFLFKLLSNEKLLTVMD